MKRDKETTRKEWNRYENARQAGKPWAFQRRRVRQTLGALLSCPVGDLIDELNRGGVR